MLPSAEIFNDDLDASHYLYTVILKRTFDICVTTCEYLCEYATTTDEHFVEPTAVDLLAW